MSAQVADAIRTVTAKIQTELEAGRRAGMIDAYDLADILLAIADELDHEYAPKKKRKAARA